MAKYDKIKDLDVARFEALINAPLPNPLPNDAILVVGAHWCSDTQTSLHNSGYPTRTQDGRPIIYFNDADPKTHKLLKDIPGHEILGGGVDSKKPPKRPIREYNYPTVVGVKDGMLTEMIYGDTVPQYGLLVPDLLQAHWEDGAAERARRAQYPRYDSKKGERRFDDNPPKDVQPNTVYAVVRSDCGHCHEFLARADYPTKTEDGRKIVYLDLAYDGDKPHDPKDRAFYERHLKAVGMQGVPTFITSDANGQLSIAASGPDRIIGQFFPRVAAAEPSRPKAPVVEELPAAPPLQEQPAAPPPGVAAKDLSDVLNAFATMRATPHGVAQGPAFTPGSETSTARSV